MVVGTYLSLSKRDSLLNLPNIFCHQYMQSMHLDLVSLFIFPKLACFLVSLPITAWNNLTIIGHASFFKLACGLLLVHMLPSPLFVYFCFMVHNRVYWWNSQIIELVKYHVQGQNSIFSNHLFFLVPYIEADSMIKET